MGRDNRVEQVGRMNNTGKREMKVASIIIFCLMIAACSPIDSTKPFDQHQAAIVAKAIK